MTAALTGGGKQKGLCTHTVICRACSAADARGQTQQVFLGADAALGNEDANTRLHDATQRSPCPNTQNYDRELKGCCWRRRTSRKFGRA